MRLMNDEGQEGGSLHKVVPVDNILWDVLDGVLEVEPVSVPVQRPFLALVKANLVHTIAECHLLCVMRYRIKVISVEHIMRTRSLGRQRITRLNSQKPGAVRDRADKHATRPQPRADVRQHCTRLLFSLERIVHAELHGHSVESSGLWR